MSIFKVLVTRTKIIPTVSQGGYMYDKELRAYSEFQYFSTLEKAKSFCQQYIPVPFDWEQLSEDLWYVEYRDASFNIYVEKDAEFDTESKPDLPDNFAERYNDGD